MNPREGGGLKYEVASAWPVNLTGVISPRQLSTANQAPITASSSVGATVFANVAPIMTFVGDRNAGGFFRMSSFNDQLFPNRNCAN